MRFFKIFTEKKLMTKVLNVSQVMISYLKTFWNLEYPGQTKKLSSPFFRFTVVLHGQIIVMDFKIAD